MISIFDLLGNGTLSILICCACSLLVGLCFGVLYHKCVKEASKSFTTTLVILPLIVQIVIMMVNGNVGIGIAVAGAFALVRFRSFQGSAKEICCLFFAMAIGLTTAMGYLFFALAMTVLICLVFIILLSSPLGKENKRLKKIRMLVPEDIDYTKAFDEVFEKYTKSYTLEKVKTADLGSVYELTYRIEMKEDILYLEKCLIDELRVRNGNLTVCCTSVQEGKDSL